MTQLLTNIGLGILLGCGGILLKYPFKKTDKKVLSSGYVSFFVLGFGLGFLLIPMIVFADSAVLSLLLKNPLLFSTKEFKIVVGLATAGAFAAGFKIGRWEA